MAGLAFASAYAGSTGFLLAAVATALPSLAVLVRRCHDQNRSGWFALIGLVPYVGWLILLVLMIVPGTAGPDRFGIAPHAPVRRQQEGADIDLCRRVDARRPNDADMDRNGRTVRERDVRAPSQDRNGSRGRAARRRFDMHWRLGRRVCAQQGP